MMNIKDKVKKELRLNAHYLDMGIMSVCEKSGVRHERLRRVWDGINTKINDIEAALNSVGLELAIVPKTDTDED